MPEKIKATPGLSSIDNSKTNDVTEIGKRKRDDYVAASKAETTAEVLDENVGEKAASMVKKPQLSKVGEKALANMAKPVEVEKTTTTKIETPEKAVEETVEKTATPTETIAKETTPTTETAKVEDEKNTLFGYDNIDEYVQETPDGLTTESGLNTSKMRLTAKGMAEMSIRRSRFGKGQSALTNALITAIPEAQTEINKLMALPPEDRKPYFDRLQKNYQISQSEMNGILANVPEYKDVKDNDGKVMTPYDAFKQDTNFLRMIHTTMYPSLRNYMDISGRGDSVSDPDYGLRYATLFQSSQPESTDDKDTIRNIQKYQGKTINKKAQTIKPTDNLKQTY